MAGGKGRLNLTETGEAVFALRHRRANRRFRSAADFVVYDGQ